LGNKRKRPTILDNQQQQEKKKVESPGDLRALLLKRRRARQATGKRDGQRQYRQVIERKRQDPGGERGKKKERGLRRANRVGKVVRRTSSRLRKRKQYRNSAKKEKEWTGTC